MKQTLVNSSARSSRSYDVFITSSHFVTGISSLKCDPIDNYRVDPMLSRCRPLLEQGVIHKPRGHLRGREGLGKGPFYNISLIQQRYSHSGFFKKNYKYGPFRSTNSGCGQKVFQKIVNSQLKGPPQFVDLPGLWYSCMEF